MVVRPASTVLGSYGGQVVRPRVGGDAQRLPGVAFDDVRRTTPSRDPYPRRIRD